MKNVSQELLQYCGGCFSHRFGAHLSLDPQFLPILHYSTISRLGNVTVKLTTARVQNNENDTSCSEDVNWKKKILYNEIYHAEKIEEKSIIEKEKNILMGESFTPADLTKVPSLFLKCMGDKKKSGIDDGLNDDVHFPYESHKKVLIDPEHTDTEQNSLDETVCYGAGKNKIEFDTDLGKIKKGDFDFKSAEHWLSKEDNEEDFYMYDSRFGTCDPKIPPSNVPCGGCGAILHCMNMGIPGFIPKEIFKDLQEVDLRGVTCQRCVFLREYNVALGINVDPNEFPKILSQIKEAKALVILMVDLLDFPCSIWPNIMDVIGRKKSLFVVGNKVDLILEEGSNKHRKMCLMNALESIGITHDQVKHISLISAKTGFGVENLITDLQRIWKNSGDVYLVGSTNVGKSTLFNALLQSDFCKVKAADLLQRATVSQWPGTTLNLLKFPILKPSSWRTAIRQKRLEFTEKQMKAMRKLQTSYLRKTHKNSHISLMGYIGRSFPRQKSFEMIGLDPNDPEYYQSKWCYDTPGVINEYQILNLFTVEELTKVLPQGMIIPRNFKLLQGNSLFIGGIARLDLIESNTNVWFTVFASRDLPVTVTNTEDADFIYQKLLGTHYFAVPCGKEERFKKWPELKSKDITVVGLISKVAAADIVLSSAGWIAITLATSRACKLRAWTPDGRGIFVRELPLIKYSSSYRERRIPGTCAYNPKVKVAEDIEVII